MTSKSEIYAERLRDPVFRTTAERLVMRAGVSAKYKGAYTLADTVILYGTDVSHRFCTLYDIVADYRGLKFKTVMREIDYAISQSSELPVRLSVMIGATIREDDIHSGLVISYLGMMFKNPNLSLYT